MKRVGDLRNVGAFQGTFDQIGKKQKTKKHELLRCFPIPSIRGLVRWT